MQEKQSLSNLNLQCPKCGLWLKPGAVTCPHDGTRVYMVQEGELFEGKYQLVAKLAAGGMGVVFKANHVGLGRTVAIKMLQMANATETSIRRFQLEATALASLDHPQLVRVYELGVTDSGQPYTVMEYVDGIGLDALIQKRGRLQLGTALNIFSQACEGLQYVHDHGILHRDLKPSNIMLIDPDSDKPMVKLVDFGIAKIVDSASAKALTQTGEVFGSPLYMSPEQAKGLMADQRSDIYSLGAVMYEVLTGSQLYDTRTVVELIVKQVSEKPKSINQIVRGVKFPNSVETMIAKMLEKDPGDRYQSVYELSQELKKLIAKNRDWYQVSVPSVLRKAGFDPYWVGCVAIGLALVGVCAYGGWSIQNIKPGKNTQLKSMDFDALSELMHKSGALRGIEDPKQTRQNVPPTSGLVADAIQSSDEKQYSSKQRALDDQINISRHGSEYQSEARAAILENRRKIDLDQIPLPRGSFATFKERRNKWVTEVSASNQSEMTDADLTFIEDLPLQEIDVSHSSLTGACLSSIGKIDTLEKVELDGIKLRPEDIRHLAKLHWLRWLTVNNCGLDDACLAELKNCKRLQILYANKNPNITAAGLKSLSGLHLTSLTLVRAGIDDSGAAEIAKMKDLIWISLVKTHAGDKTLSALSGLKRLRAIELDDTDITDAGLLQLKAPKLMTLSIIGCRQITQAAVSQFVNLHLPIGLAWAPSKGGLTSGVNSPDIEEMR